MAWALDFVGNTSTVKRRIGPFPLPTNYTQELRIDVTFVHRASGGFQCIFNTPVTAVANTNFFMGFSSTGVIHFYSSGVTLNTGTTPVAGQVYTVSVTVSTAKLVSISVNGGTVYSATYANLDASRYAEMVSGGTTQPDGTSYRDPFVGQLRRVETWVGGVKTGDYDTSSSGGAGTTITNSINSAVATQAGTWPADNPEWVFYSSGATYQLTAQGGTFTYSGQTAALNRGFKLAAQGGTYSYTGASANLSYTTATIYRLDALGASYSYAGASASLLRGFKLAAQGGAYSYAGSDAVLRRGFKLAANGGAYNYAGADASLTYVAGPTVYRLTALGVTYVYSGADAALTATGVVPASNPNAFHITARVAGPQHISAMIGGTLTNNAKIGGNMTISARLSQ